MTAKLAAAHLRVSPLYYASGRGLKAWEASLRRGVKTKSSKTEHKTLSFRTEEYDEESGIFSGYAAVYGNIDSGGDIIEPGAFTKTIAEGWERVKILALHNDCWLPIGRPLELREDSNGLFIKAKISDTSMGRDIKVLLKDGVLNELSIGYDPIVFDYDENGIRHLREVKLWEVSIVTWAMNPEATITDYKQATDASGFLDAFLEAATSEVKAGRKISGTRLKALKDASASLKAATKVLDGIIQEASDSEKSVTRTPNNRAGKAAPTGINYEILL
ncbi:peptidase U35 [Anaerotruncus colihominis]|nr:peptidase U35 [Anaerotruncus colihominis]